jgi:hypothetical protein
MNNCRSTDKAHTTTFRVRVSRFFKQGDRWYFNTREGNPEGPFYKRVAAEERLENYIKLVNSGFYGNASELELAPIEIRRN